MKIITGAAAAAFLAGTSLLTGALPASAQGMGAGQGMGDPYSAGDFAASNNMSNLDQHTVHGTTDAEGEAEEMRLRGECAKALPVLQRYSDRGDGHETSQFNLGLCMFDLAKKEPDAAKAASMKQEGAGWILTAANAGLARAQGEAVLLYLDGIGVKPDPVEAGKWAYLFHDNGSRLVFGFPDIAPALHDRLDAAMTHDQRKEAHARADAWVTTARMVDN